jgi:hypothetical protein
MLVRASYSVRERVTMEGVPVDRRRDNFVCKSGCDETTTLGGVLLLIVQTRTIEKSLEYEQPVKWPLLAQGELV